MFSQSKKGYGLGILPPWLRLALVLLSTTLFVSITKLNHACLFFAAGVALVFLNKRINWKPLLASIPSTMVLMFLGNLLFSPMEKQGFQFLVFRINNLGLLLGAIRAMRIGGVMSISFAWLFSTPIPEMYEGLKWFRPGNEWVLGILRGVQIARREFTVVAQSLLIRGLRWDSLTSNVRNLLPLLSGIVPRLFENIQKATLASESHGRSEDGNGEIRVVGLHVRYHKGSGDVLEGLNLKILPGEFVYLAGPVGTGKTSLLRTLGGIVPRLMGEMKGVVETDGVNTLDVPLSTISRIARYVSPDPFASIMGLTAGQEMMFLAQDEVEARRSLETMGILDRWNQETTRLSGGQQTRLVLAGVLASESPILLLDGAMEQLDPGGRQDFLDALFRLQAARQCTVVAADPFWRELQPLVTRVLVIEQKRVMADLSPAEFFVPDWLKRCHLLEDLVPISKPPLGEIVSQMNGVKVVLGDSLILQGVDLTLRAGELLAITGANGSGKTTAMLTLAGAIKPLEGTVRTSGRVGYVFQEPWLQMIAMTAQEEIAFGPNVLGWDESRRDRFVQEQLVWTGLEPSDCPLDLHPSTSRMLAIAAMNTDVQVLILDEPTVGLDVVGIRRVLGLVESLLALGKAVIIVTHNEQIARMASRVIVMDDGCIVNEMEQQRRPE